MFRTQILIPALMIGAGLFLTTTSARAQVVIAPQPAVVVRPRLVAVPVAPPVVYQPAPIVVVPVHHHHYQVVYRLNCNQSWLTYQSYHSSAFAQDVADQIRRQGYEVAIWR